MSHRVTLVDVGAAGDEMDDEALEDLVTGADEQARRRARLVRDAIALGPTRAAAEHAVTRQTAAKWLARYRRGGAALLRGSADRRRATDEARHAVLTAPLWMPTSKWSSRSIAGALGVSQSFVARTWADADAARGTADDLIAGVREHEHDLVGLLVAPTHSVLVLRASSRKLSPGRVDPRVARTWRTVLAADLVRGQAAEASSPVPRDFWGEVASAGPDLVAIASCEGPVPAAVPVRACRSAAEWQALTRLVLDRVAPRAAEQLQAELRAWHQHPRHPFGWVAPQADPDTVPGRGPGARIAARRAGPEQALADEIVASIRDDVTSGRLAGGDRVTERSLAGRLHTTRARVRESIRLLERDGLLTVTRGRGVVVALPTEGDVVETYAARSALGALVVRAAARRAPASRPVARSMETVEAHAGQGDVQRSSRADIDFQDTLAEVSGLARVGPMLQLLADQLRMFIAVMGIDYAYPVDSIVFHDREIVAAIDAGDADLAAARWRAKMDDALDYMLGQLGPARTGAVRRDDARGPLDVGDRRAEDIRGARGH